MALTDNLLAYYKCDENAANTTVSDAHGSETGTASTNTSNIYAAGGKINSAFDLDGSSERIDLTNLLSGVSAMSYSCWVNTDTTGSYRRVISKDDSAASYNTTLRKTSSEKMQMLLSTTTNGSITGSTTLSIGTWYHILFTYDGTNMNLYINGSIDATAVPHTGNLKTASDIITLGTYRGGGGEYWNGLIDEVGIWDRGLTSSEATELYNSGNGLAYPFTSDVTIEPSTVHFSTSAGVPDYFIDVTQGPIHFITSIPTPTIIGPVPPTFNSGTVVIGTSTVTGRFIDKVYPIEEGLDVKDKHTGTGVLSPTGINGQKTTVFPKNKSLLY